MYDAIVTGGGFYGTAIALYLAQRRGLKHVLLVEREEALFRRASLHNQARVHNGYHYPRSFTTAFRSRINLPRFLQDYTSAIRSDFTKLYAISRRNSRVTARQFVRFCQAIGAKLEAPPPSLRALFDPRLIEEVFLAEEYAFDAQVLAGLAAEELRASGVEIRLGAEVTAVSHCGEGLALTLRDGEMLRARHVFNCAYSGLNHFGGVQAQLKHELTEMALVDLPAPLRGLGITVMDGPFFSLMPFPSRGLHTLSHVRYTPHFSWTGGCAGNPYACLADPPPSRVERMLRDAARYIPAVAEAHYRESMFEIKTVLLKNEGDDGRPILYEKQKELPGLVSILGGKIDNIYDVLEKLEEERL